MHWGWGGTASEPKHSRVLLSTVLRTPTGLLFGQEGDREAPTPAPGRRSRGSCKVRLAQHARTAGGPCCAGPRRASKHRTGTQPALAHLSERLRAQGGRHTQAHQATGGGLYKVSTAALPPTNWLGRCQGLTSAAVEPPVLLGWRGAAGPVGQRSLWHTACQQSTRFQPHRVLSLLKEGPSYSLQSQACRKVYNK